jgi:hypothetical protein
MNRKDFALLLGSGRAMDVVHFGSGPARTFTYEVKLGTTPHNQPRADYIGGHLVVTIDRDDAEAWLSSDRIGFDHRQTAGDGSAIRVIVEKDFACLHGPAGDESADAWAFPIPSTAASKTS